MKSRHLTETDLANLAFKPVAMKRQTLLALEKPKPISGSYEPFRQHNGDAVNEQMPLFVGSQAATPLGKLEEVVAKACRGSDDLLKMNLPVARATHDYAVKNSLQARREDIRSLVLPYGHKYQFGMPLLMVYPDGRIVAVFPDLRRTQALSKVAQFFVFSMMHHRWRENYPDLESVGLEIWRYRNNTDRDIVPIACSEQELFPYDALIADVRETYDIWHQVLTEGSDVRRHGSLSDAGPLFGSAKA